MGGIDPYRGPAFSHSSLVLTAAIDGQGVALGRLVLAADDLAAGRLVCPFGPVVEAQMSYYLVSPPALAGQPMVTCFRNWLLEESLTTQDRKIGLPRK